MPRMLADVVLDARRAMRVDAIAAKIGIRGGRRERAGPILVPARIRVPLQRFAQLQTVNMPSVVM